MRPSTAARPPVPHAAAQAGLRTYHLPQPFSRLTDPAKFVPAWLRREAYISAGSAGGAAEARAAGKARVLEIYAELGMRVRTPARRVGSDSFDLPVALHVPAQRADDFEYASSAPRSH